MVSLHRNAVDKGKAACPPTVSEWPSSRQSLHSLINDAGANAEVSLIIKTIRFASVDRGTLATGGKLQQSPGGPLPALDLIKLELNDITAISVYLHRSHILRREYGQ